MKESQNMYFWSGFLTIGGCIASFILGVVINDLLSIPVIVIGCISSIVFGVFMNGFASIVGDMSIIARHFAPEKENSEKKHNISPKKIIDQHNISLEETIDQIE